MNYCLICRTISKVHSVIFHKIAVLLILCEIFLRLSHGRFHIMKPHSGLLKAHRHVWSMTHREPRKTTFLHRLFAAGSAHAQDRIHPFGQRLRHCRRQGLPLGGTATRGRRNREITGAECFLSRLCKPVNSWEPRSGKKSRNSACFARQVLYEFFTDMNCGRGD